ncbi:hypothetical protein HOP52_08615 [Halomonas campisalis]|uniref:Uncharacterized protein n=1 Tax=Billgrantia campisalis TaxID=74661 RepID=A0ABS9P7Q4_9GAMM|nr:hypothetical protein [Halomonas campisalis]MCG6657815.1 hypothetical protein [Halomonas campisalis]MDR5864713.1 hypothetical protein [Halomonas campisalis]
MSADFRGSAHHDNGSPDELAKPLDAAIGRLAVANAVADASPLMFDARGLDTLLLRQIPVINPQPATQFAPRLHVFHYDPLIKRASRPIFPPLK